VTLTGQEHPDPIPANAFTALNLATFLFHLKSYACTKRGERSILALIPSTSSAGERRREGQQSLFGSNRPLQRKQRYAAAGSRSSTRSKKVNGYHYHALPIAKSAEDCVNEYKLVQEAMDLLNFHNNGSTGKDVLLPPIFKLSDGDTGSDEDGWVEACMSSQLDIYQEIDLETILQAECLVKLLLDTHDWAKESPYSGLVGVVSEMDGCAKHLSKLYHTLEGAVQIVRPKATVNGSFYYMFQLASGNGRYPELDALHEREANLLQKVKGNKNADNDMNNHRQLATLREEISILEKQTTNKLIASMIDAAPHVERALTALARLDVIFARALFALDYNGVIPEVGDESNIIVRNFVHPVLALEKSISGVVPIDLLLPGPVLVISGPNAGGKTLALKSFGLAACFVKLGIPITVNQIPSEESEMRVDFFENIFVQIGDSQDLLLGESTLMAWLNSCSKLILRMETTKIGGTLALLDELVSLCLFRTMNSVYYDFIFSQMAIH
jgi:DNA mismatch repair protein MutS2